MSFFIVILCSFLTVANAADPNKAHPHKGISTKFNNPSKTTLSDSDKQTLASGKPVLKQVKEGNGGRGIAVFDVQANEQIVWDVITSYSSYPKWIDEISQAKTYVNNGTNIYVDFIISSYGVDVQYYIKHLYRPDQGYLTWELDYSRQSDLDDSTGYWLVYPSPIDSSKTRVEYSVDLRVQDWIPGFIQKMLAESGLEDASQWVKRESEKRAQ
jgi:hypothetical protein